MQVNLFSRWPLVVLTIATVACTTQTTGSSSVNAEAVSSAQLAHNGSFYLEAGDTMPPQAIWTGAKPGSEWTVRLSGPAEFSTQRTEVSVTADQLGAIIAPSFTLTDADSGARVELAGVDIPGVEIFAVHDGWVTQMQSMLKSDAGIIDIGEHHAVLVESELDVDDNGFVMGDGNVAEKALCWALFTGNIGHITYDASCRAVHSAWLIPEDGSPAFTPVNSGVRYTADGFKVGNTIWKIDGSTYVTISCSNGGWSSSTCVNNAAALLGKRAPYVVRAGTFGNEPPAGRAAQPVR